MAGGMQGLDLNFPYPNEDKSTEEQLQEITDYLYMLLGNLKYILKNLGVNNFNEAELLDLSETITEPINVQITDVEGNVTELKVTAEGLQTRVGSAEGNISSLEQTSSNLTSRVGSAEGDISSLRQTASGLSVRVSSVEKRNTVAINANGLYVIDKDGNTTQLTGDQITSGILSGVIIRSFGPGASVMISNGMVHFGRSESDFSAGGVGYEYGTGKVYLQSYDRTPLKITAYNAGISIDAQGGQTVYIGTSNNGENVSIGNGDGDVYLNGNVYINGVLQGG